MSEAGSAGGVEDEGDHDVAMSEISSKPDSPFPVVIIDNVMLTRDSTTNEIVSYLHLCNLSTAASIFQNNSVDGDALPLFVSKFSNVVSLIKDIDLSSKVIIALKRAFKDISLRPIVLPPETHLKNEDMQHSLSHPQVQPQSQLFPPQLSQTNSGASMAPALQQPLQSVTTLSRVVLSQGDPKIKLELPSALIAPPPPPSSSSQPLPLPSDLLKSVAIPPIPAFTITPAISTPTPIKPPPLQQPPTPTKGKHNASLSSSSSSPAKTPTSPSKPSSSASSSPSSSSPKKTRKGGDKPIYPCPVCGVTYVSRSGLAQHKYEHNGNYPYRCEYCGKGWAFKSTYLIHLRTHTGAKPLVCQSCHKQFKTKLLLSLHICT